MTRRLNELHINEVIRAINLDTIESVSITKAKKPRGAFNLNYTLCKEGTVNIVDISKGVVGYNVKVQLINALNEVKEALVNHKINSVSLKYDRKDGNMTYQLIQK